MHSANQIEPKYHYFNFFWVRSPFELFLFCILICSYQKGKWKQKPEQSKRNNNVMIIQICWNARKDIHLNWVFRCERNIKWFCQLLTKCPGHCHIHSIQNQEKPCDGNGCPEYYQIESIKDMTLRSLRIKNGALSLCSSTSFSFPSTIAK